MVKKSSATLLIAILLLLLHFRAAIAGGGGDYPRRPKLVLIIVIDQMRYDYLVRFRTRFVQGGFNLMLNGGANFADCRYDYATTITGPGHATLLTGTYSNIHGIIGNEWYDRSLRRMVNCVEDPATVMVSGPDRTDESRGSSPHYLIGSTLGDELRAATDFRSKVLSIALKDRAAILMGGHSPTAAYWYDPGSGQFVTSTYYMAALPAWVVTFNRKRPGKDYCGRNWDALPSTSEGKNTQFSLFKANYDEPCPDTKFMDWLDRTPYMSEIELSFAEEAIKGEHLGQGPDTDLLAISLSENDYVGHAFGPYSPQVVDVTLRTDQYLASFFTALDKLVGIKKVWIALSADHGVAPNPDFIQGRKWGLGMAKPPLIRKAVEDAMAAQFGPGDWVVGSSGPYLYLDSDALQKRHIDVPTAEEVAATAAASVPGVTAAFTRAQFLTGSLPPSALGRKALNSFNPKRGGDVFVVLDPYALPFSGSDQTTHGSAWSYDSQVPLILWGGAFRPGVYFDQCQPTDLAATLAATLGLVQPSGSQGRPLASAIR